MTEPKDWDGGRRATGTGIGTPDVDTGDPATLGRDDEAGVEQTGIRQERPSDAVATRPEDTDQEASRLDVPGRD